MHSMPLFARSKWLLHHQWRGLLEVIKRGYLAENRRRQIGEAE
jgi:hypothetical protein